MRIQKVRATALAAAAAVLFAAAPAGVKAFSDFNTVQELDINSNAFNQVLVHNFQSGNSISGPVAFGNRTVREIFQVQVDSFTGAFIYDYALGRFTAGYYAIRELL